MINRFFKKINIIEIPYLPSQIDLNDLTDDLRIADRDKYTVMQHEGKEYIIYKELAAGKFGVSHLVQDNEGQFYVLKVQTRDIKKAIAEHGLNLKLQQSPPVKNKNKHLADSDSVDKYEFLINLAKGETIQNLTEREIDFTLNNEEEDLHTFITPVVRLQLGIEILKAINKLNKQGILHRDLSAENVFINPLLQTAELIDLGLAIKTANGKANDKLRGSTITYSQELRATLLKHLNANGLGSNHDPDVTYSKKTEAYAAGILLSVFYHLFLGPENIDDINTWEPGKTYIVDTSDPVFLYNTALPESIRPQVLNVLHQLTAVEDKRITISEAIKYLENIKFEFLKSEKINIKVAILDLNEYLPANAALKNKIINDLKVNADEVWLVDTGHHKLTKKQCVEIQREIEHNTSSKGIKVGNKIFIDTDKQKVEKKLKNYLADKDTRKIPSVCHWEEPERTPGLQSNIL